MAAGEVRAGKAFVELTAKDKTGPIWAKLGKQLDVLGKKIATFGRDLIKYSSLAIAPMLGSVAVLAKWADELADTSTKIGVSTQALQAFTHAAELSDSNITDLTTSIVKMLKNLAAWENGSESMIEVFDKLGLSIQDLQGKTVDEQFVKIADAIMQLPTPAQRAAAAIAIFGKSGANLIPTMKELSQLVAEFQRSGMGLSDADVKAASALNDDFARLKNAAFAVYLRIGTALAPAIQNLTTALLNVSQSVMRFMQLNSGLILTLTKALAASIALGAAFVVFGTALRAPQLAIKVLSVTLVGLFKFIQPLVGAIAGLGGALLQGAKAALIFIANIVRVAVVSTAAVAVNLLTKALIGLGYALLYVLTTNFSILIIKGVIAVFALIAAFDILKSAIGSVGDWLSEKFQSAMSATFQAVGNYFKSVGQELSKIADFVVSRFGDIWNTIKQTFGTVIELIKAGDLQGAIKAATAGIETVWKQTVLFMEESWLLTVNAMSEAFIGLKDTVRSVVNDIRESVAEFLISGGALENANSWQIFGVDTAAEIERRKKLNEEAARLGLPQEQSFQDEVAGVIKEQFQANRDAISAETAAAMQAGQSQLQQRLAEIEAERATLREQLTQDLAAAASNLPPAVAPDAEGDPNNLNNLPPEKNPQIARERQRLSDLIKGASKAETKNAAKSLGDALEKGSVEAFKKGYENRILDLNAQQVGLLGQIAGLLQKQGNNKVVIVGKH